MLINTNSFIAGIKREYWEHKRTILGIPLAIAALCILSALMAMIAANHFESSIKDAVGFNANDSELNIEIDGETYQNFDEAKQGLRAALSDKADEVSFGLMAFFIGAAWVAAYYYLLATLYTDRKDKSILFWKSLPISETQNVLTKLAFACIGFVAVAIVIGWITSVVLSIIGFGSGQNIQVEFSFVELVVWPIGALILGLLWGAPIFTYTILVSAAAKRSPGLLLILPVIVIPVLEWIFFSTSHVATFFGHHMPFAVLEAISDEGGVAGATAYYFTDQSMSMILGLVVAVGFCVAAVWYRDNKFEL
ncbi:MAG: ABC-2 type transport system permease protein [Arenicella sp.]|jgi:ABC-2 type transport system permease protein